MAKRDIQKNIQEGKHILRSDRKRAGAIDLSYSELNYFMERIEKRGELFESLCGMFCFALAVGYRAGTREARKARKV